MFEGIINFFKKMGKQEKEQVKSKDAAKERLHLVLMQDRANVSADFLDLMKQEIIEVIKKYIDVDENAIDVRLTNKSNSDGTTGAPALYANIPIVSIKEEVRGVSSQKQETKVEPQPKQEENQKVEKVEEKIEDQKESEKVEEVTNLEAEPKQEETLPEGEESKEQQEKKEQPLPQEKEKQEEALEEKKA